MNRLYLLPALGLLALIPGDSHGFRPPPAGGGRPGPVIHTPTFTAPPVYHPPVTPRPAPPVYHAPATTHAPPPTVHRPAFVPQPSRPSTPVVIHPSVTPQRPVVGIGGQHPGPHWPAGTARGIYVQRPNGAYLPGYAYYHHWHEPWHHGYWHTWYFRPWLWFAEGVAAGWLLSTGEVVAYWNPYYIVPGVPVYDYSRPIAVPAPVAVAPDATTPSPSYYPPPASSTDEGAAAAARLIDSARQAFRTNDSAGALQLADRAIRQSPNDTALHEFRALVLFAQRQYQDAAGVLYGVLAVGPGWDWETLRGLYADVNVYTAQLRALEAFVEANPRDAASRFLLAYHYLVIDARDAAAKMFRSVVALQPKDQLAAHLLQMLEKKDDAERPAPRL